MMNSEHQQQARRLTEYRESLRQRSERRTREAHVRARGRGRGRRSRDEIEGLTSPRRLNLGPPVQDPMIYPDLYSPSGFDMLGILIRIRTRPNPTFNIGNVDSSVALVLCDSSLPDSPIVYCSEPFQLLTGYSQREVLGRNCRFLQHPPPLSLPPPTAGLASPSPPSSTPSKSASPNPVASCPSPPAPSVEPSSIPHPPAVNKAEASTQSFNEAPRKEIRERLARGEEAQVRLRNYTKHGHRFMNLLTIIPISWDRDTDGVEKRYVVGFQANTEGLFLGS